MPLNFSDLLRSSSTVVSKNIDNITNQYFEGKYILIFPFCSPKLVKKKWPHYQDLITLINKHYGKKYNIAIAPGPNEVEASKVYGVNVILNKSLPVDIIE